MSTEIDFPRGGSTRLQSPLQTVWKKDNKEKRGVKRNSSNIQNPSKVFKFLFKTDEFLF